MSFKFCVPPDYDKFPPGTRFQGVIRTIVNADRKLCFIVPKDDYAKLKKTEKFNPDPEHDALNKLPKIGRVAFFHHKSRDKFYRAFTLNSNRTADSRALFLYDTGEVIHDKFSEEQFYVIPDEIEEPLAFALFARIKVPVHEDDEDYNPVNISNLTKQFLTFTVLKNTPNCTEEFVMHSKLRCIVLSLAETVDGHENSNFDSDDDIATPKRVVIEPIYSPVRSTFTLDDLPKFDTGHVAAGSIILVYPLKCATGDDSSIYANIANMANDFPAFSKAIISEGFALTIWLNKLETVASLRCIEDDDGASVRPSIGELLIASCADEDEAGSSESMKRVVVKRVHVSGTMAEVFAIDHGCTHRLNTNELFKFPIKCSTQPPRCVHLTASNFNRTSSSTLPSVLMARVESTTFERSQLHIRAKLYDLMGKSLC